MHRDVSIVLAPGAENNSFAQMLSELVRQNLESKPHKKVDLHALDGTVALVADDAGLALTLAFERGTLTVHDGIHEVPDVTVRGSAEAIMAMSNVPLTARFGLPLPLDRGAAEDLRAMFSRMRSGELRVYGMLGRLAFLSRFTRVMSVNG